MRILLDENLPHDFRHFLAEHELTTVAWLGWQGLSNGELLRRAADYGFDVMLTMDRGVRYQQNLRDLPISVVLIRAPTNTIDDLRPLVSDVLSVLARLTPRSLVTIPPPP